MTIVCNGAPPSESVMLLREGALALLETGATTKLRDVERRIKALETENGQLRLELAALREFVAAYDNVQQTWESCVSLSDVERLNTANERLDIQRQRLATEFGMALPGAEAEG